MEIKELYEHSEFKPIYEEYLTAHDLKSSLTFDEYNHDFTCEMFNATYYVLPMIKRKRKKQDPDTYFLDIIRGFDPDNLQVFMRESFTHDKVANMLTVESREYLKSGEIIEKTKVVDLTLEKLMTREPLSQKKLKKIRARKNRN